MCRLFDELRAAIERSDMSRYAISKATGIDQGQLSRLMDGTGGLSVERLEQLADALDLEIVVRPRRKRKGR
ncbi:MAG: helix-turn-helix transcriptional regulator [Planctomycetes bacterium]|nr:helix-turn-helix transcriptional regulator [Planctomycetota bacterium]